MTAKTNRFAAFTQDELDSLALALGEYVQDRYGETAAYVGDDGLDDQRVHLFAEVLRAGAHPDPYMRDAAARVRRVVKR